MFKLYLKIAFRNLWKYRTQSLIGIFGLAFGLIRMIFREYTWQVIIAGFIALPPVYIAMSRWLQGYAYRTNIPWWLLAGVIATVITVVLLTVLGQTLKAANGNPAEVVKSE